MAKKMDFNIIINEFNSRNYELLTIEEEYKNNNTKLFYICKNHRNEGVKVTDWASLKQGKNHCVSCKPMSKEKRVYNIDIVKQIFQDKGLILTEGQTYQNKRIPMKFICQKHYEVGEQQIPVITLEKENSVGCKHCDLEKRINEQKINFDEVVNLFIESDYILLSTEKDYINNKTPLEYICKDHSELVQKISYNNLQNYHGCKYCDIERKTGKTSPTWKGGVTPLNLSIRMSNEYSVWRMSVFTRDNFICQSCGANQHLQAHHLNSFATHEEQRFDIDNGVTLCEKCHDNKHIGSFHNTYGTQNTTPEQFYEFKVMKQQELANLNKNNLNTNSVKEVNDECFI